MKLLIFSCVRAHNHMCIFMCMQLHKKHTDTIYKHASFKATCLGPHTLAFTLTKTPLNSSGTRCQQSFAASCQFKENSCVVPDALLDVFVQCCTRILISSHPIVAMYSLLLSSNKNPKLGINLCSVPDLSKPRNRVTMIS